MDERGLKQLQEGRGVGETYSRDDFSQQRGKDGMEFFVMLHTSSKRREAEALRACGKSTRLCPIAWDTGIGYEAQAQYMHQLSGVSVHDAYVNDWGWDQEVKEHYDCAQCERLATVGAEAVAANRGPWNCWLLKPPGICQGVPWLEHKKVEGMPYFCHETQIQQPAKYRADFPIRIGALASIQDWDIVCWHYYAPPRGLSTDERPFDRTMDVTVGSHPQGYHYTYDEVQSAMMRAAAYVWRNELLRPAPNPTKFIFGRKTLYNPASMDYGHSCGRLGLDMLYTVYQHGVRIRTDPRREDDQVVGPRVSFDDRHSHNPYTPTKQITFDWKRGHVVYDAPGVAAFAGFISQVGGTHRFRKAGVELSDVDIYDPPGIYDPVTDQEGYMAFALYSEDGLPLPRTQSATLSIVSTSFNRGFSLARSDVEKAGCLDHPLAQGAPERRQWGEEPVLVARAGATVSCGALNGMEYTVYDWHMKPLASGTITDGRITVRNDEPVFVVRFER